ncbi:helix-turn-helix transcriptional regulator [Mucilaginibacter lappiensis]|jgi:predicted DNA-binding transcriptional regulator YafY|uniref:helix-turn-helix transcriptional regulator n=1 Tax=Mucilaginibacter lappiensis TaxID=354630 RepID=UPI003D21FEA0
MNRIDRLLEMLAVLQTKKVVTVDYLKEKFHISTRTVYQDIQLIAELRISVQYESDKGCIILKGYYHSLSGDQSSDPGAHVSQSIILIPAALKNDIMTLISANESEKGKLK